MARIESEQPADQTVLEAIRDILNSIRTDQEVGNDAMERVQQQLGQINNDNNLELGERFIA